LHGSVEHVEEAGSVGFAERFAMALTEGVGGAQVIHQIARGHLVADIGRCEGVAVMAQSLGSGFDAFCGQWDIGGDADVLALNAICDPDVGDVWAAFDDDCMYERVRVGSEAAVGYYIGFQFVAVGDFEGFGADGAGVCVDVDFGHRLGDGQVLSASAWKAIWSSMKLATKK